MEQKYNSPPQLDELEILTPVHRSAILVMPSTNAKGIIDIPSELRNKIYNNLFDDQTATWHLMQTKSLCPSSAQVLRTCQLVWWEALPLLYSRSTLKIYEAYELPVISDHIGPRASTLVKSIEFLFDLEEGRDPSHIFRSDDHEVYQSMPGLKFLRLRDPFSNWTIPLFEKSDSKNAGTFSLSSPCFVQKDNFQSLLRPTSLLSKLFEQKPDLRVELWIGNQYEVRRRPKRTMLRQFWMTYRVLNRERAIGIVKLDLEYEGSQDELVDMVNSMEDPYHEADNEECDSESNSEEALSGNYSEVERESDSEVETESNSEVEDQVIEGK
ncbi:hypothetical protein EJ08DRAFT_701563 [Tothia fuscella]|uniref:F-box domain-containing protein n=1 Tax=Tothia fuscella TaxID=1048955 RepID=A0A9P4NIK9_9PEZI|nr:hypothetical protein EJ08DRAFT_701563 [Tothia fuscella]